MRRKCPMTHRQSRTGSILVITMVVLFVVALIAAALVQLLMLQTRQSKRSEQRQQAAWLAESALARGESALKNDANYAGETWRVPNELLGAGQSGAVEIRVENVTEPNPKPGRRVLVTATYPEIGVHRNEVQRQLFVAQVRPGGTP